MSEVQKVKFLLKIKIYLVPNFGKHYSEGIGNKCVSLI